MPSLTTLAPFCAVVLPMWTMLSAWSNNHMAAPVKVAMQQTTPELSGTFWTLPPEPTPTRAKTLQNPPEPSKTFQNQPFKTFRKLASETYTISHRNSPEPSATCLRIRRNRPEPSGTRLRNLHQHTPELSGTFRNLPPEPTPAHAGTLRNLPEPSSRTCSCGPRRHTPELIWAEDPISLRCWGKIPP